MTDMQLKFLSLQEQERAARAQEAQRAAELRAQRRRIDAEVDARTTSTEHDRFMNVLERARETGSTDELKRLYPELFTLSNIEAATTLTSDVASSGTRKIFGMSPQDMIRSLWDMGKGAVNTLLRLP